MPTDRPTEYRPRPRTLSVIRNSATVTGIQMAPPSPEPLRPIRTTGTLKLRPPTERREIAAERTVERDGGRASGGRSPTTSQPTNQPSGISWRRWRWRRRRRTGKNCQFDSQGESVSQSLSQSLSQHCPFFGREVGDEEAPSVGLSSVRRCSFLYSWCGGPWPGAVQSIHTEVS